MGPDGDLLARTLASRQDGLITRHQLRACGLSDTQIRRRLRRGHLIRLHRGVFLMGGAALNLRARVRAALLACGPGAVASHATAAALWGVGQEPDVIDISVYGSRDPRPAGLRVHRVARPFGPDVRTRNGLRCTSPARTIWDLAASQPRVEVEYAIQEAAARGLVRDGELEAAAARNAGRPGTQLIRAILSIEAGTGFTRSHAERLLVQLIDGAHLPAPEKNVYVDGYLVDAVWRRQRLIVEIDGFATHGTRVAFAADRARDAALLAVGWRVLRFTYAQLRDEPMLVLAQLVRALA